MARPLARTLLMIGLASLGSASHAQSVPSANAIALPASPKSQGEAKPPVDERARPTRDDRRDGEKRDGDKRNGDRREGDRRSSARSIMDAVRRDGGPLELVPLLLSKNALREMELDESLKGDVEAFLAGMQKKWEEERKLAEQNPTSAHSVPMSERVAKASAGFNEVFQKLTPQQQDRVLGAFVQWRKYRALSNRMVAVDKLGLSGPEADELRQNIETIRDEVMNESRDKFRQLWENGRDRSEAEQLMHKTREKIDERIKAKLTAAQIDKLEALKGKPLSPEVIKSLDIPPPPRPR